jgi:hypothetical protein
LIVHFFRAWYEIHFGPWHKTTALLFSSTKHHLSR